MSKDALLEYLEALRVRYINATKNKKTVILNEFCETAGYERKHAIKLLNKDSSANTNKPGPERVYHDELVVHLVKLWELMRRMCSKRMKCALPLWLNYYEIDSLSQEIRALLLKISPSTIDRLLSPYRQEFKKGLSSTKSGAFIKSLIPIELLDAKVKEPGFIEADTVAHCGDSLEGVFANSLTMTDLLSGWTANRATLTKTSELVLDKIKESRSALPFTMKGFACDNGSEFINYSLVNYFNSSKIGKIKFVRRRAYKKNDNAHVEQKNHTHVRQLFGYVRVEDQELVDLMNDIYTNYWNPYQNFFCPVLKLKEKIRIGGRYRKFYDQPKTPYQRLIEFGHLTGIQIESLKTTFELLNPIELKQGLDKKLALFFKKSKELSIAREGGLENNKAS